MCCYFQVFVSSDPFDCQKPYNDSLMCKHVEGYVNCILLNITLPPQQCKSSVPKKHTKRGLAVYFDHFYTLQIIVSHKPNLVVWLEKPSFTLDQQIYAVHVLVCNRYPAQSG